MVAFVNLASYHMYYPLIEALGERLVQCEERFVKTALC